MTDIERDRALELVEHLGSDACTREEVEAAVTDGGECLVCGKPWALPWGTPGRCAHDEVSVIAYLRAQLAAASPRGRE